MGLINSNASVTCHDCIFFMPTEVQFGTGKLRGLPLELQVSADLSSRDKIMLITDSGVAAAGLINKIKDPFENAGLEICSIFENVPPESDSSVAKHIATIAQDKNIDLFLALGGGSVMDTAKVVSVLASHGGEATDYQGGFMIPGPIVPVIAIPTTVGTGSEVTMVAMLKDSGSSNKILISSPYLYPRMAVLDPEMVATLPSHLVAWTGMDALTHAIESYTCTEHGPIAESIALRAAEMIADNLKLAVTEFGITDARSKMQLASTMAAIAFTNSPVGASHAIAHAVGALYGIHHGLANAIALPYVMEFNLEACASGYASIGYALGVKSSGSDESRAKDCITAVRSLARSINIPALYREVKVPNSEDAIQKIAEMAMEDFCLLFNPRKGSSEEIFDLVRKTV